MIFEIFYKEDPQNDRNGKMYCAGIVDETSVLEAYLRCMRGVQWITTGNVRFIQPGDIIKESNGARHLVIRGGTQKLDAVNTAEKSLDDSPIDDIIEEENNELHSQYDLF